MDSSSVLLTCEVASWSTICGVLCKLFPCVLGFDPLLSKCTCGRREGKSNNKILKSEGGQTHEKQQQQLDTAIVGGKLTTWLYTAIICTALLKRTYIAWAHLHSVGSTMLYEVYIAKCN